MVLTMAIVGNNYPAPILRSFRAFLRGGKEQQYSDAITLFSRREIRPAA